ncbi:hypothetical protein [Helicobacter sp. 23-1045]
MPSQNLPRKSQNLMQILRKFHKIAESSTKLFLWIASYELHQSSDGSVGD